MPNLEHIGKVKFFDATKGFGFIECWDNRMDYYFHAKQLKEPRINDDDYVAFNLAPSRRKKNTREAIQIIKAFNYLKTKEQLQGAFLKHPYTGFRISICRRLKEEEVIELLKKELETLKEEHEYTPLDIVSGLHDFYSSFNKADRLKLELKNQIAEFVRNHTTEETKVQLWIDGVIDQQPELQEIKKVFQKLTDRQQKLKICSKLSEASIFDFVSTEIISLGLENERLAATELRALYSFIGDLNLDDEYLKLINDQFESLIASHANDEAQFDLWLEGKHVKQPEDSQIESAFKSAQEWRRKEIFKRCHLETRTKLIDVLVQVYTPEKTFDFIVNHLCSFPEITQLIAIQNLLNNEFWQKIPDYILFQKANAYYAEELSNEERLRLSLKGYTEPPAQDYLFSELQEFSKEKVQSIVNKLLKTEKDKKEFLHRYSNIVIKRLIEENQAEPLPRDEDRAKWERNSRYKLEDLVWVLDNLEPETTLQTAISKLPNWAQIRLWELKKIDQPQPETLEAYLIEIAGSIEEELTYWKSQDLITEDDYLLILKPIISSTNLIASPKAYSLLISTLNLLIKGFEAEDLTALIEPQNRPLARLHLWLHGTSGHFDFDEFKVNLPLLSPQDQILFVKKLFWRHHKGIEGLSIQMLDEISRIDLRKYLEIKKTDKENVIDISLDLTIASIKKFSTNQEFPHERELLKVFLNGVNNRLKSKFEIGSLFEGCEGRMKAKFKPHPNRNIVKTPFGDDNYYWAISFERNDHDFEKILGAIRQFPRRRWYPDWEHWGVPINETDRIKDFAQNFRFFIEDPDHPDVYILNKHLFVFKREKVPSGIKFCVGREAATLDRTHGTPFWWCNNAPCHSNCKTIHSADEWENYTFLDFARIFEFNLDGISSTGDQVEDGNYYQFISLINRFNQLLEHIHCRECDNVLYPVEDSHFAHYRVVRFQCRNSGCTEHEKEVYLHHCLNGRCNSIIDSRDSAQCEHGLYICSNNSCGCCCSHKMLSKRLSDLKLNGGYIHPQLIYQVKHKLGHLERAEHFCYKCASPMNEVEPEVFRCPRCNNEYDLKDNRFKRDNRNLPKP